MTEDPRISVLFVDDSEPLRSTLRRNLKHAPANIRWAGSAEEALTLIAAEVPDLVVSDYRMEGGLDGLSLLERVHAAHPHVRCVLHTGEPAHTTLQASAFQVLFKPCPTSAFMQLIEAVHGEKDATR
jgi:DNA-binding NtrC family response regulator